MPGTVNFADWKFTWSIPSLSGEGLVISKADFRGTRVIYRASQPFALVPYHDDNPTFKDGLGAQCSGVPYTALKPTAPNVPSSSLPPGNKALNDNEAVAVEYVGATLTTPAMAVVWAKFQVGNYQYIHRWEFQADGAIHAEVGLGGKLHSMPGPDGRPGGRGHIHNFYFRLDFDVVASTPNLVQRFGHKGNALPDDVWSDITFEAKETIDFHQFTKWRILYKVPVFEGDFPRLRSYELIPCSEGSSDGKYSTGDVWVVKYKGASEYGADVGPDPTFPGKCTDNVLDTKYVNGEGVDGEDVVVWYCLRTHHLPRHMSEEKKVVPYEFIGFHMQPRDFLTDTPTNLYPTTPPSP
jgi:primary-amine oxidase